MRRIYYIGLFLICCSVQAITPNLFRALIHRESISQSLITRREPSVDVHMLSRFLKELKNIPCLLITRFGADQEVLQTLFPHAIIYEASPEDEIVTLVNKIEDFVNEHSAYVAVITYLDELNDALQDAVQQKNRHICYLTIDGLTDAIENLTLDVPKLLKCMNRTIHVVCTAALIPIKFEERKEQYIRGLSRIIELGYHPYIVESCVPRQHTFLDDLSSRVLYSQTNDVTIRNKGVNEFTSLISAFNTWDFDDEDIVLKFTGRYYFETDALLRFLEENDDIDCAAKFETVSLPGRDVDAVLTGCFAMRFGLFKTMLASFDYKQLEDDFVCVEHVVGPYLNTIAEQGIRVTRVPVLGVEANMFYTQGSDEISHW